MARIHLLTQYVWPDAAPTALYAEQIATRLHEQGHDVRLIGGNGSYRSVPREKPPVPILHLDHYTGRRGNLVQVLAAYWSVKRVFAHYIADFVRRGDIVIVTSAPPNTIQLAADIHRRGARAIYRLEDYYPELIRGIREYPALARYALSRYWDHCLSQWDRVIKISANLGGPAHNSAVIRNWPTVQFDREVPAEPGTALYSGNLGYGHDIGLFVAACEELRDKGYQITVRADGAGVARLPGWLKVQRFADPETLKRDLLRHEVHLIAAHPRIQRAIFPSKIWNSIAARRQLVCTGFEGEMLRELEASKRAPFDQHLDQWAEAVADRSIEHVFATPVAAEKAEPALAA